MRSIIKYVIFSSILIILTIKSCNASVIRDNSEKVDTKNTDKVKREADPKAKETQKGEKELFPDWVPFKKNKEELGELVPVKSKPKKRLALPANYVLKTVEPLDDGIYDKGGDVDGEDEYERKEWSDLNRPVNNDEGEKKSNVEEKSKTLGNEQEDTAQEDEDNKDAEELENDKTSDDKKETDEIKKKESTNNNQNANEKKQVQITDNDKKKVQEEEEEEEDEEEKALRLKKEEEEKAKANEKKIKILREVDDLKERHAAEQRFISERIREEDKRNEELDRLLSENPRYNKYDNVKRDQDTSDYDDYEDSTLKVNDKYPIHASPKTAKTTRYTESTRDAEDNWTTNSDKPEENRIKATRRYNDDENWTRKSKKFNDDNRIKTTRKYDDDENTNQTLDGNEEDIKKSTPKRKKFSARRKLAGSKNNRNNDNTSQKPQRFTTNRAREELTESETTITTDLPETFQKIDKVRTYLEPQLKENESNEPTTFVMKRRKVKPKRRLKIKTIPEPDTYVAETIADKASTKAANLVVADAVPASSDHKKEGGGNFSQKKGGGMEHHAEEQSESESHGKKAYEAVHKDSKSAKGHHDKEHHSGEYKDNGGHDKSHQEESGHYGLHHHEEKGNKHAKYEETGKHSKGHSTKGSHNIHKKDEYEKKVEFFEEDGDSGEEEKHGGFGEEKGHKSGGHFKKAGLKKSHDDLEMGKAVHHAKGGHYIVDKGHKKALGHDSHEQVGHAHTHNGHKEGGKKWMFHHGSPAKTANLVIIDRRADRFMHGPQYYG